jgi:anaerobic magnesium-protoporphyrin IX monomethyl ester cyclase
MKVTLVSPEGPARVDREYNAGLGAGFSVGTSIRSRVLEFLRSRMANPPFLTFGYAGAILRQNGHTVVSSSRVPEDGVMVVAPSLANFTGDMEAILSAARRPNVRSIVIGHLATVRPREFAPYSNLVIKGEPESVFQAIHGDSIPGGVVAADPVRNLDSLPFPAWDVFPIQKSRFSFAFPESRFAFVQASRSCPYTCGYCPYVTIGSYRRRSIKSVLEELSHLETHYGIRNVVFRDPTFTLDRRWTSAFCEAVIQKHSSLRWECETRLDRLDAELLVLMRRSGLASLKVGIESAEPSVLRNVDRTPGVLLHQQDILSTCDRLGIKVVAFYVLGLPTDTEETVHATVNYAKRLNTSVARFHIFTPLPGTPLWGALENQIFETDWNKFDLFNVVFHHKHLSKEKLLALKEYAYVSYYFRLRYLYALLRRATRDRVARISVRCSGWNLWH